MKASKTETVSPPGSAITLILFAVAATWLALQLLALRTLVAGAVKVDPSEVANLILGLSGLVVGIVFAGGVAGMAMRNFGPKALGFLANLPRIVTSVLGGLGVAIVMAVATYFTFAETPGLGMLIGGVAGVSGLLGGCLASIRSIHLATAGLTGTAVLLAVFFLRGYFTPELLAGLGRGISAYRTLAIVGGLVAGLCVGLAAFIYLRRRAPQTGLYGYLGAGAAPGVLWLISEIITQITASQLTGPAGEGQIDLDALSLQISAQSQFNGGLAALFTGATTAVLAFGLLIPSKNKRNKSAEANSKKPKGGPKTDASSTKRATRSGTPGKQASKAGKSSSKAQRAK
ncbi:hypothetical protein FB566_1261 [Stackebrandtia endophytica]|uniref:Uncharacterized protein n=1 Tax=Stackebrandtia endophytica TaxID=1496996 RepID=A0A543AT58_9ACTN|nr:hypothetical protein [Stackebrandtia endophytica]TQL75748.1 hypothetical protein FB566_1261 [Stackebrandtia endophytica]